MHKKSLLVESVFFFLKAYINIENNTISLLNDFYKKKY
jgi:hypothetical protein